MGSVTPETMRAVVFNGPFEVEVLNKPVPKILAPTDAILKVSASALCGSDLHYFRGHQKATPGFICGHETVGHITTLGSSVTNFPIGGHVIVPFSTACGSCFFCSSGESSRCSKGALFGCITPSATIDGGQAEYIHVSHAASSLVKAPSSIPEEMLVLIADVFPTGYFAASRFLKDVPETKKEDITAVVLGCRPLTGGRAKIFAVDSVPKRLAAAEKLGALPVALSDDPVAKIKAASHGRGVDVVMEVVGHVDALELAFELIRPFGKISSVGVHNEQISFPGFALYSKNVKMAFGRCPVRSIFDEALTVYEVLEEKLRFLCQVKMPLGGAPKAFRLFEKQELHKILFSL